MIWRSIYPLIFRTGWNTPKARAYSHRTGELFSRASLRTSIPNVASVLAYRPLADNRQSQQITVSGFIRTVRNHKHRSFMEIGDGSTIHPLQVVLKPHQAKSLATGAAVRITGVWQLAPPNKEQEYELLADNITIVGPADAESYPIQKKYHSVEFLRTIPHLRLRTPFNALLARLRSECDFYISNFFHELEFIRLQPPIITSSDCEGAGEVFTVQSNPAVFNEKEGLSSSEPEATSFFQTPKYLTVSSQLHLEAFVHEHRNVWSLSPTFRAEKSDTSRHLSEFWMLEAEIQTETLRDVMDLVENMIRTLTLNLQKSKLMDDIISSKCMGETETATSLKSMHDLIRGRWKGLLRKSWARITYGEVIQRLQHAVDSKQVEFEHQPSWATGLQLEHEKFVAAEFGQGSPVFVTEYPQEIKAFYMLPSELKDESEPSATAACFDLLVPDICEIVGGSLREHRLGYLIDAMHKHGLVRTSVTRSIKDDGKNGQPLIDAGNLDWYLDLRRFGSVPHGGFGLGLDRLVGYLAGVHNIKDVIAWPRWHGRCDC